MTDVDREIKRLISYIRSCREANIDCTVTIDKSLTHGVLNALEKIQQYREIGTVEECREAAEGRKAKKARFYAHNFYCPECGEIVGNNEFNWTNNFCRNCGQAIQWDANLEGMEDEL